MIIYRGHRYRAVTRQAASLRVASKETFYHGTATGSDNEILRQILKKGLEADPQDRRYVPPEDLDESDVMQVRDVEYVTYGGTYLASDLVTALRYAQGAKAQIGGDLVIVVAQIETRAPEIAIDEDQFLSTVNIRLFNRVITTAVEEATGASMAFGKDVYDAVQQGKVDLDKYVEPFLVALLKQKPVAVPVESLLRYRGEIVEMLTLAFEFEAATDRQAPEEARDPTEIASDFRRRANDLFRRISGLADVVPGRNVRSLDTVTYRGANRILGVLVFNSRKGRVQYSADNNGMAHTAAEIESIVGTRINWGVKTQKQYDDISDWVDDALEVADFRMNNEGEPPECGNFDVDPAVCDEIVSSWSEFVDEYSAAVLGQHRVTVHESLLAIQRTVESCGGDDALELLDEFMPTLLQGGWVEDDESNCIDEEQIHAVVDNVVYEAELDIFAKAAEELE